MEQVKILSDIIEELVEKGYKLSFEALDNAKFDLIDNAVQRLSAAAFEIDEVYSCYEYSGAADIVYVFAISSATYGKSIVINAITEEATISLSQIFQKIQSAVIRLFKE